MLENLLLYRLIIVNLLGLLLVGYAQFNGWNEAIIAGDHTGIVWIVIAFFVVFQVSLWIRAGKVSRGLNALKRGEVPDIDAAKVAEKGAHLEDMIGWMLLIGLVGNVLGIMLSIDNANLGGGDTAAAIEGLLGSMDVAFGATIVSGVLSVWAGINYRILKTATVCWLADYKTARNDKFTAEWRSKAAARPEPV